MEGQKKPEMKILILVQGFMNSLGIYEIIGLTNRIKPKHQQSSPT